MTQVTSKASRVEEIKRVWTPEANLWTSIGEVEVGFAFPALGPGNYHEIVKQVIDAGQGLPTGTQTAFMLDDVYNSGDVKNHPRAESVRGKMNDAWIWVSQVEVWTPQSIRNPGMYSVFDEKGEGLARIYTTEELEDRLSGGDTERGVRFSQDRTVAFAPQNTIMAGSHKKGTLSQDGAYIATYGVDGTEKLDAVAENFVLKPHSWILNNNSDGNVQRVSALDRSRGLNDGRLSADFNSSGDGRGGYVFSVSGSRDSAEGTAPKN